MREAGHVQVHPRGRDRSCEAVERDVAARRGPSPVSPWKSRPPSAEVEVGREAGRLPDHRLHPVASELVAVAVEEHVDVLLDRLRREELGIGAPEERLGAPRSELEQPPDPALRVREHEVVLPRVRAVVRVEARVHPAELGEAHRHVAVVEDDRDPEPLSQCVRDAAEMGHWDGEDDDRVGLLVLDEPLEVTLPAGRHPARRSSRE